MAITLGNIINSGNRASSTGYTVSYTTTSTTKGLVVILTGADTSATESVATVTFNGVSLSSLRRYRVSPYQVWIFYLANPAITTANLVVTMGGSNTDMQFTAVGLQSNGLIAAESFAESSTLATQTSHSLSVPSLKAGHTIALGGIVYVNSAITNLSVSTGTEIAGSEADMGSQVVGCAYNFDSSGTTTITWAESVAGISHGLIHSFYEYEDITITLNTPTDNATNVALQPQLKFTGTNNLGSDMSYEVTLVAGYEDKTLQTVTPTSVTLPTGENVCYSIVDDGDYFYATMATSPAKLVRILKSDLATRTTVTFPTGANTAYSMCQDSSYVYVGCATVVSPGKVVRVSKSDMSVTVFTCQPGENDIRSITNDETYVYAVCSTNPTIVVRIDVSDFSTYTSTAVSATSNVWACTSDANYLYLGEYVESAPKITRLNKSDLYTYTQVTCANGTYIAKSMANDDNYVYVGFGSTMQRCGRISKFTFSSVQYLDLPNPTIYSITQNAEYVYFGSANAGAITAVNKSTFTVSYTKTIGLTKLYALCDDGTNMFAGLDTSPAKIYKYDYSTRLLTTFTSDIDSGFTRTGDSDPFTSGQEVTFTPPTALDSNISYQWRVRAIAPTGLNIWTKWTTYYTFTTGTGETWTVKVVKYWNGSTWVTKPLKYWNGSAWVEKSLKISM